jgi:hypothetical protein
MHNPTYKCKPLWDIKNWRRQTALGIEESNALLGLICVFFGDLGDVNIAEMDVEMDM